jgi:hypothetical protein
MLPLECIRHRVVTRSSRTDKPEESGGRWKGGLEVEEGGRVRNAATIDKGTRGVSSNVVISYLTLSWTVWNWVLRPSSVTASEGVAVHRRASQILNRDFFAILYAGCRQLSLLMYWTFWSMASGKSRAIYAQNVRYYQVGEYSPLIHLLNLIDNSDVEPSDVRSDVCMSSEAKLNLQGCSAEFIG